MTKLSNVLSDRLCYGLSNKILHSKNQLEISDYLNRFKPIKLTNTKINLSYLIQSEHDGTPDYVIIGPTVNVKPYTVNFTNPGTYIRGFIKRLGEDSYDPINNELLTEFASFASSIIKQYQPIDHYEVSHEFLDSAWLNNAPYNLSQKSNFHFRLDHFLEGKRRGLYVCKSFIKREFYEDIKEPRLINSRSDMFKAVVAPFIKKIEENVYDQHFIKHKTKQEIYERLMNIQKEFIRVFETDYSSFERSFSPELLNAVELKFFKHMLSNNKDVYNIIKKAYKRDNVLISKFWRVNLAGRRMSGEMWTSLCNGLMNSLLIRFICYKSNVHHYDYVVEGDDGFIGADGSLNFEIVAKLGFDLKLEQGQHVNDLSFCGLNMGPHGLYPDFHRHIKKLGLSHDFSLLHSVQNKSKKAYKKSRELIRAKALSHLASSPPMPILTPLCRKIVQLTNHYRINAEQVRLNLSWREQGYLSRETLHYTIDKANMQFNSDIDRETRLYFAHRFKMPPEQQLQYENLIFAQNDLDFQLNIYDELAGSHFPYPAAGVGYDDTAFSRTPNIAQAYPDEEEQIQQTTIQSESQTTQKPTTTTTQTNAYVNTESNAIRECHSSKINCSQNKQSIINGYTSDGSRLGCTYSYPDSHD